MTRTAPPLNEPERLKSEIERIKTLDLDGLRAQWRNVFTKRAPESLPRGLIVRVLVYRAQADALGDLDPSVVRVLEGYKARDAQQRRREGKERRSGTSSSNASPRIKPGSVLVREWAGCMHRVTSLEDGFAWEGNSYRSLSHVARAITGTQWNGRRFFGVDRAKEETNNRRKARGARNLTARNSESVQSKGEVES